MRAARIFLTAAVLVVAIASVANTPAALTRSTVAAGGGTAVGPTATIRYTVGQSVVGTTTSSGNELSAGFWFRDAERVTAVDDAPALPAVYRLHPNTPNPFNPRTEIRFDLPQPASSLALRVYDLAGRRVATLAEGPHAAGTHRVVWDGEDSMGNPVASGIYLARLDSPAFTQTSKLALVR